ncbi:MAG: reverse transcriptase-like protein, partial [Candidatus Phytoplasma australasiaticum]|nr:reverse transcriptase-like protein [Candidatus Phytoplasma australasiaticum]
MNWCPPPAGYLKINVDAAVRRHQHLVCAGVVVRNAAGDLMGACTLIWHTVTDPSIAEAWACLRGLIFAEDMGYHHVILESDSLTVVKKLLEPSEDLSPCRALIEKGKRLLRSIRSASVRHVRRERNKAAHTLANWGTANPSPSYWIEEEPPVIQGIML